jgi:hypothetical protein
VSRIALNDLKSWTKNNGGVFFCSRDYSSSQYEHQLSLFEKSKIDTTQPPYLTFVLFNEYDQISKNPSITNYGFQDSIINQVEFYLVCSNKRNVNRAMKLFADNFYVIYQLQDIYQVGLKGICPKDITYSISLYYDLIYEVFNPQYTSEEKIDLQGQQIKSLMMEIEQLKKQIEDFEKEQNNTNVSFINRLSKLESKRKRGND